MTAEVAVINKSAIALAADSAITVTTFVDGTKAEKVFNTANKLFTLSKYHPVGIMVYNSMSLGGIPWETIIKQYRQELGRNKFDTVADYCSDFFKYLDTTNELVNPNEREHIITRLLFVSFSKLSTRIKKASQATEVFEKEIKRLEEMGFSDGFNEETEEDVKNHYEQSIQDASKFAFKVSYVQGQKRRLSRLAALYLTRDEKLDGYSGVVIAGFGDKEIFPIVHTYIADAFVSGKVKKTYNGNWFPTEHKQGKVIPFAQDDVTRTVLDGVSPSYSNEVLKQVIKFLVDLPADIIEKIEELSDDQKKAYIADATTGMVGPAKDFLTSLERHAGENHTNQIEHAISVLPVGELATVAEVFINLTQIRKRMSLEAETVGGPTDVAVISKGDGFIWVKRKYYFEPKLNHSYFDKYFDT